MMIEKFNSKNKTHNVIATLFIVIFLLIIPIGNKLGIISDISINLWGRYISFAIVALGIDLIWGFTGILSLCQALFFGLGGYAIAMHMSMKQNPNGVSGSILPDFMQWNNILTLPWFWKPFQYFPIALVLGLIIPAILAFILSYVAFRSRLKGVYFAVITQALALAAYLLFLRNETMLGGTNGLTDFKSILGFSLQSPDVKLGLYIISVLVLIGAYILSRKLIHSKVGEVLIAIRDSENRIRYTGYSVASFKIFIFIFAAVLAAIGGMLYVPQTGIITPGRMDVQASIEMIVWVAVGGRASLAGAILGAFGVNLLYSYSTSALPGSWLYILGFLFIAVVLFIPTGMVGLFSKLDFSTLKKLKSKIPFLTKPLEGKEDAFKIADPTTKIVELK